MSAHRVSVVMIACNGERYLREAMEMELTLLEELGK